MRTIASILAGAIALSLAGCSEDTIPTVENPALDAAADSTSAEDSAPVADSSVADSAVADTATMPDTATTTDTPSFEAPAVEVGGTFSCVSETCSATLQFCRVATSPGICPAPDSGICPAGCPGCPALSQKCETMPLKCWAKPSCACILIEVCGSPSNGTCMEKDGGFVAGCNGV